MGLGNLLLAGLDESEDRLTLSSMFEEMPVDLKTFTEDNLYLGKALGGHFHISPKQFELVRHIEQIYFPSTLRMLAGEEVRKERMVSGKYVTTYQKPYWGEPVRMTNRITAMVGKGGGKDSTVRIATMRIIYLLLCLKSPQKYFGKAEIDSIHTLNIATTAAQARTAFFDPMREMAKVSPWFANKHEPTTNVLRFDKKLYSISGNSEAESQEGLNLILAVADEIDGFASSKDTRKKSTVAVTSTAEHIMSMLKSSAATRFPDVYKLVAISYPRYRGSPIMRLLGEAKKDNVEMGEKSRFFAMGPLATWDFNPTVTKEQFADDYRIDPIEAAAKYECRPAAAENPYFRNQEAVLQCFQKEEKPRVEINYKLIGNSWSPEYIISDQLQPIKGALYAVHVDLSIKEDRAGIAMAHVVKQEEFETLTVDEEGNQDVVVREFRPLIKLDFAAGYQADKTVEPAREIQIRWARQFVMDLISKGFRIRYLTYDSFQSADSMQIMEKQRGVEVDKVSTDRSAEPWRNLRDVFNDGRLIAAYDQLLIDEIFGLTLNMDNGKVDHSPYGSKDIADAVACAVMGAIQLGGREAVGSPRAYYGSSGISVGGDLDIPGSPKLLDLDHLPNSGDFYNF